MIRLLVLIVERAVTFPIPFPVISMTPFCVKFPIILSLNFAVETPNVGTDTVDPEPRVTPLGLTIKTLPPPDRFPSIKVLFELFTKLR